MFPRIHCFYSKPENSNQAAHGPPYSQQFPLYTQCCELTVVFFRYVSRYHVKDSARHVILGTQQFKPNEFASQINLSMENAWGILRCVIDICRKLDEGKYLILKDPNKVSRRRFVKAPGLWGGVNGELTGCNCVSRSK